MKGHVVVLLAVDVPAERDERQRGVHAVHLRWWDTQSNAITSAVLNGVNGGRWK